MKRVIFFTCLYLLGKHPLRAQVNITNTGTLYVTGSNDTLFVNGSINNTSSGAFTNNGKMYIKQNFSNSQTSWSIGTGEIVFNGTTDQTLSTVASSAFYKLTVNKPAGTVQLSSAATINHTLNLTSGTLVLGNYDLTISSAAGITGAGNGSYIVPTGSGLLKQQVAGNSSKLFPVGTSAAYTPLTIGLSLLSTTDVFSVSMLPAVYAHGTSGAVNNANIVNATWLVNEAVAGGSNATLTVQWPSSLELTGFNRSFSRLAHYTGGTWDYGSVNIIASGSDPYSISRSGFTSFSPFAVAMNMAVLPAEDLELTGKNYGNRNRLTWSVSEERNTAHFILEASTNTIDFNEVGKVSAAGYSNSAKEYGLFHNNINGQTYYYRVKQVDADGTQSYSKTIRIEAAQLKQPVLYPNPVKNKTTVTFSLSEAGNMQFGITNASGLLLYKRQQLFNKGQQNAEFDCSFLPAGSYVLQLTDDKGSVQMIRFIKTN